MTVIRVDGQILRIGRADGFGIELSALHRRVVGIDPKNQELVVVGDEHVTGRRIEREAGRFVREVQYAERVDGSAVGPQGEQVVRPEKRRFIDFRIRQVEGLRIGDIGQS